MDSTPLHNFMEWEYLLEHISLCAQELCYKFLPEGSQHLAPDADFFRAWLSTHSGQSQPQHQYNMRPNFFPPYASTIVDALLHSTRHPSDSDKEVFLARANPRASPITDPSLAGLHRVQNLNDFFNSKRQYYRTLALEQFKSLRFVAGLDAWSKFEHAYSKFVTITDPDANVTTLISDVFSRIDNVDTSQLTLWRSMWDDKKVHSPRLYDIFRFLDTRLPAQAITTGMSPLPAHAQPSAMLTTTNAPRSQHAAAPTQQRQFDQSVNRPPRQQSCSICGSTSHARENCTYSSDVICDYCENIGHIKKICRTKQRHEASRQPTSRPKHRSHRAATHTLQHAA